MTNEILNHFILLLHRNVDDVLSEEEYNFLKNIIHSKNSSIEKEALECEYKKIIEDIKSNYRLFINTIKKYNIKNLKEEELINLCKHIPLKTYNISLAMWFIQEKNGKELFKTYFDAICFYSRDYADKNHINDFHLFIDTIRKHKINIEKENYPKIVKYPNNLDYIKQDFKNNYDSFNNELLKIYAEYITYNYIKSRFKKCGREDLSDKVVWVSKDAGEYFIYTIFYINLKNNPEYIFVKPIYETNNVDSFDLSDKEYEFIKNKEQNSLRCIIARVYVKENGSCQIYLFDKVHEDYISSSYSEDIYMKTKNNGYTRKKYN